MNSSNDRKQLKRPCFELNQDELNEKVTLINNNKKKKDEDMNNLTTTNQGMQNSQDMSAVPLFNANDAGPYAVWIRSKIQDKELSALKVSLVSDKLAYTSIESCTKKRKSNVVVMLKDIQEANKLIRDPNLTAKNLETFKPKVARKSRKAIIRGVDVDIEDEVLLENIQYVNRFKLIDFKRMNMRNRTPKSEEDKWIPSRSILLTFEGQTLPREVFNAK
ncbi:hypothetical protein TKK_0016388 [Trichogramma kaykai]|uniref:Uncharacterized protein n=1 Tax=Trichogramma kaykai TaxID=54128 RepID=A0ABD2W642_9HYME